MASVFLQVILLVTLVGVLDCAPPGTPAPPNPPKESHAFSGVDGSKADGKNTAPKSRLVREAQQPQNVQPPRPAVTQTKLLQNNPTTARSRVGRAAVDESETHDINKPHHANVPLGLSRDDLEGHSTTPKSRQARDTDHDGKPRDDHEGHSTTPKARPARAADHDGKPHDDHEGHSTTPKSRPVRATEPEVKPHVDLTRPVHQVGVPLAKLGNEEHTTPTKSRPARAADHDGKPHDDHEDHNTTPKSRPVRAADHDGKPHDDHEGHSTTPKSRPARATEQEVKPQHDLSHSAQGKPVGRDSVPPLAGQQTRHTRDTNDKTDASSNPTVQHHNARSHGPTQGDLANIKRAREEHQLTAQH